MYSTTGTGNPRKCFFLKNPHQTQNPHKSNIITSFPRHVLNSKRRTKCIEPQEPVIRGKCLCFKNPHQTENPNKSNNITRFHDTFLTQKDVPNVVNHLSGKSPANAFALKTPTKLKIPINPTT